MIISASPQLYRQTLALLSEATSHRNYFSGTISFTHEALACRLTTSVIVYRHTVSAPDGVSHPIKELIPVWWEFHTHIDGEEMLNDFSFSELNTYL